MRVSLALSALVLASSIVACAPAEEDVVAASEAQQIAAPILDCSKPGSFPQEAMLALPGTYERAAVTPKDAMSTLTIGPLQDIAGWAGKHATYTRDGRTGTATTLMDNPALGPFISLEDDFYFVTASLVEDGTLKAMCLADGGGETFLMTRKGS